MNMKSSGVDNSYIFLWVKYVFSLIFRVSLKNSIYNSLNVFKILTFYFRYQN